MRLIRSILAVSLALLVLMASTSFIIGLHRCGGRVQNVALFTQAEGCAMERQLPPCHRQMTKSCCEDHEIFHEGQSFKTVQASFELATPFISIITSAPVLITKVINSEAPFHAATDYDPPLQTQDLTVSLQVFLI